LIHNDLITTLNFRSSENELKNLTELSFFEKLGLTNQKKMQMMIVQGKEKIDESYYWLKSTII
jgi:hypothetical protein